MASEANRAYCEIVALLILADAAVTDAERTFLDDIMSRFGFLNDDRKAIMNAVDIGGPVAPLVAKLDAAGRESLLPDLEAAAALDGDLAPGERQVIEDVRAALRTTAPE